MTTPISQDPLARLAEMQDWNSPAVEIASQQLIRKAFTVLPPKTAVAVRNALHGTWLHEPLHVIMTDVPVGSWTAAVVFDALGAISGSEVMDKGADALVILGLLGAVGASITGLNDWAEIERPAPRRIGAMHAILNVTSVLLFGASWLERRRVKSGKKSSRVTARALAGVGFAVNSASAHLGGNLIYEHGIGVEQKTPREQSRSRGQLITALPQNSSLNSHSSCLDRRRTQAMLSSSEL